jgi:plastocyanin
MTDETTTIDDAPVEAPSEAVEHAPATAKVRWYQRSTGGQTYLDRYVFPALVPVVSVAIIVFYVINVSRVFLSGKGTIAIVAASIVTVAILAVSSIISAAARMRTQSLAVLTSVALLAVMFAGWIAVGHAQEAKEATAVACTPVTATVKVNVPNALKFDKSSYSAKAGCVQIDYGGTASHTLAFDPPGPASPILESSAGAKSTFAWSLTAGTYTIYCTVPGHRTAGMVASLVVK